MQVTIDENKILTEILERTYRYFNGVSTWNLEDRISEALIADSQAIQDLVLGALPENKVIKPRQTGTKSLVALGYNQALGEIKANLKQLGIGE